MGNACTASPRNTPKPKTDDPAVKVKHPPPKANRAPQQANPKPQPNAFKSASMQDKMDHDIENIKKANAELKRKNDELQKETTKWEKKYSMLRKEQMVANVGNEVHGKSAAAQYVTNSGAQKQDLQESRSVVQEGGLGETYSTVQRMDSVDQRLIFNTIREKAAVAEQDARTLQAKLNETERAAEEAKEKSAKLERQTKEMQSHQLVMASEAQEHQEKVDALSQQVTMLQQALEVAFPEPGSGSGDSANQSEKVEQLRTLQAELLYAKTKAKEHEEAAERAKQLEEQLLESRMQAAELVAQTDQLQAENIRLRRQTAQ